ncbi:hypothetical protein M3P21_22255, partial [Ruegeria sp. 2012CJ41-6]
KIHIEAIELLLASITLTMGEDGARASFLFGPPGARHWEKRIGIEIYYHFVDLNLAALHVRSVGPSYLKALPLTEICSRLGSFMSENFGYIGNLTFGSRDERPLNLWIPEKEKFELARALASCALFQPAEELTVFPLIPVVVNTSFRTDQFFFSSPQDENSFFLDDERLRQEFETTNFPPQIDFKGRIRNPNSWLGVYSPDYRAALKTRSSILGALALTALPHNRHMFSGREVFGGRCSISKEGITWSFEREHTPPCMYDIQVTDVDAGWMTILSDKLRTADKGMTRELKALEYYFRAWPLSPEERFPVLCMALDAIFGDSNNATQAVVDGVNDTLGGTASGRQLRAILSLRGSVIHGGAPDVYDSSKYPKYYRQYGCDPIRDLELVVSACLKERVFQGELREHPDPSGDVVEKARAEGRLPRKVEAVSILNPKA